MGRIRTIKPEFFQHERLSELGAETHLLAAGLLTYADDDGYFNANPGLVKAAVFPLRECSVSIHDMLAALSNIGFLRLGNGSDGRRYGHVIEFLKHQRINRPTPSKIKGLDIAWESSRNTHTQLTESSPPEQGTGNREKEHGTGNREGETADAVVADATPKLDTAPDCPHSEIVDLYHQYCPTLPRVRDWTEKRKTALRKLWREKNERQRIEFWHEYFSIVGRSAFLRGENDKSWCADIDWLLKPDKFQKVLEGRYSDAPQKLVSTKTARNAEALIGWANGESGQVQVRGIDDINGGDVRQGNVSSISRDVLQRPVVIPD